jgi:hypothetical protein
MIKKPFRKLLLILLVTLQVSSCGHRIRENKQSEQVSQQATIGRQKIGILNFDRDRVTANQFKTHSLQNSFDQTSAVLIAGFGIERPQKMDVGVYGRVGESRVFVARRTKIPDYDRLYWVMVRVLSEKYGCLIRAKSSFQNNVKFVCRDKRTVVMDRFIDDRFAMFSVRQFDEQGREIFMKPKNVAIKDGATQL